MVIVRFVPPTEQSFRSYPVGSKAERNMANLFPPVVNVKQAALEIGTNVAFHTLFEVSDLDNNEITKYRFRDNSNINYGSFFTLKGVRQVANTWIEIDASLLYEVKYVAALIEHSESISVQVYDGKWSNVDAAVMFTVPRNLYKPVVTATPGSVLETEAIKIETLFDVSDADGSPILRYYFVDRRFNNNGGHFIFDNVRLPSAQWFIVEADELDRLRYIGGSFGTQTENVGVRVYDGKFWSDTVDFAVTTTPNLFRPVVNAFQIDTPTGRSVRADSMFSWSDADGNSAKFFAFYDTGPDATSGYFTVNGVKQAAEQWFVVEGKDLTSVRYQTSQVASYENFRVRVFDGRYWSIVDAAQIRSVPRPKIEVLDLEMAVDTLEKISISSLFNKIDNGPDYIQYQVLDENDFFRSGELWIGDQTLEQGQIVTLDAAQFASLEFEGAVTDYGRQVDEILVRADNGTFWTEWQRIRINTDPVADDALVLGPPLDQTQYSNADGTKTVVHYTFIDGNGTQPAIPTYYPCPPDQFHPECANPTPLDVPMREMVREVLAWYETVADLDFIEVPFQNDAANANMIFGLFDADGVGGELAHAYLPGFDAGYGTFGGDVWYDNADFPIGATDVSKGSSMRATTLHEVGHALGFKHPFDADFGLPVLPVSVDFDYNTVMSYSGDRNFHPEEPSTGMLWDITGIQRIYRPNEEYNTGNDHYFFDLTDSHLQALWDAGGIDTINLTNQAQDNVIDLHEGARSSLNGVANSLLIAYGTTIENARGGFGNDTLQGNEIRNLLFGNQGNDTLEGNGGNDVLRGGEGNDTYVWRLGDGRDTIREEQKGGVDVLEIHEGTQLDLLEDDLAFRRLGRDLRIDLTLNQREAHGSIIIKDMAWGASGVETLRLFDGDGRQIGEDIDLRSVFVQTETRRQRFRVTSQEGQFGFIAVPV